MRVIVQNLKVQATEKLELVPLQGVLGDHRTALADLHREGAGAYRVAVAVAYCGGLRGCDRIERAVQVSVSHEFRDRLDR
jgi:hypothetical protein